MVSRLCLAVGLVGLLVCLCWNAMFDGLGRIHQDKLKIELDTISFVAAATNPLDVSIENDSGCTVSIVGLTWC